MTEERSTQQSFPVLANLHNHRQIKITFYEATFANDVPRFRSTLYCRGHTKLKLANQRRISAQFLNGKLILAPCAACYLQP